MTGPLNSLKLGFFGSGSLAKSLIKGYLKSRFVRGDQIFMTSSSQQKNNKRAEKLGIIASNPDEILEKASVIFLCVKPLDLPSLIPTLRGISHTVFSPIAAASFKHFKSLGFEGKRLCRFMPNTAVCEGEGLLPFCTKDSSASLESFVEEILKPLGHAFPMEESFLDALTVACSSGSAFVLELMDYWIEWLQGEGVEESLARELVARTFLGTSLMLKNRQDKALSGLQQEIASKKGVTEEGLKSMRKLEIDGLLRLSFERSALKLRELSALLKKRS